MLFRSRLKVVDQLEVTSPCPDENFTENADVSGDGWYCHQCEKQVFDLAKMSRTEIADLVKISGENFCAVISRRKDGSLITNEPASASNSLLPAGALLASSLLFGSAAVAQTEVGGVSAPPAKCETSVSRGEVAVAVTPTPAATATPTANDGGDKSACQDGKDQTSTPNNGTPINVPQNSGRVPALRGKVSIVPKK